NRAAQQNLAHRFGDTFLWFGLVNSYFDPMQWRSHRSNHVVRWSVNTGATSRFSQAVGLKQIDSKVMKIVGDLGIETRASRNEVPHFVSEELMDPTKEEFTAVDA